MVDMQQLQKSWEDIFTASLDTLKESLVSSITEFVLASIQKPCDSLSVRKTKSGHEIAAPRRENDAGLLLRPDKKLQDQVLDVNLKAAAVNLEKQNPNVKQCSKNHHKLNSLVVEELQVYMEVYSSRLLYLKLPLQPNVVIKLALHLGGRKVHISKRLRAGIRPILYYNGRPPDFLCLKTNANVLDKLYKIKSKGLRQPGVVLMAFDRLEAYSWIKRTIKRAKKRKASVSSKTNPARSKVDDVVQQGDAHEHISLQSSVVAAAVQVNPTKKWSDPVLVQGNSPIQLKIGLNQIKLQANPCSVMSTLQAIGSIQLGIIPNQTKWKAQIGGVGAYFSLKTNDRPPEPSKESMGVGSDVQQVVFMSKRGQATELNASKAWLIWLDSGRTRGLLLPTSDARVLERQGSNPTSEMKLVFGAIERPQSLSWKELTGLQYTFCCNTLVLGCTRVWLLRYNRGRLRMKFFKLHH